MSRRTGTLAFSAQAGEQQKNAIARTEQDDQTGFNFPFEIADWKKLRKFDFRKFTIMSRVFNALVACLKIQVRRAQKRSAFRRIR